MTTQCVDFETRLFPSTFEVLVRIELRNQLARWSSPNTIVAWQPQKVSSSMDIRAEQRLRGMRMMRFFVAVVIVTAILLYLLDLV